MDDHGQRTTMDDHGRRTTMDDRRDDSTTMIGDDARDRKAHV